MLKVGLTGGIASGKSVVAEMFVALGARLIQADQIAHEVFFRHRGTETQRKTLREQLGLNHIFVVVSSFDRPVILHSRPSSVTLCLCGEGFFSARQAC
jgi:hypothetical protein